MPRLSRVTVKRWAARVMLLIATLALVATASPPVRARLIPSNQWRQVFYDNFANGLDTASWGAYRGVPGSDPGGFWAPSHAVVVNGILNLQTYRDPRYRRRWVSGGVSSGPALHQIYGKYEFRVRMERGKGIALVALLWPVSGWPPEIDFGENGGLTTARDHISASFHFGKKDHQVQNQVPVDLTHWHTLGIEWIPGELIYLLDGRPWWILKSRAVPRQPMALDIQTEAGTCGIWWIPCPDSTTPPHVNAQIKWVAAYAYLGPRKR